MTSTTTSQRDYDALLLDLDGTLLDEHSRIRPRNVERLRALQDSGVQVVVATGRSTIATLEVVAPLELTSPLVVFNGAAIYCPQRERHIEERVLSNRTLERALELAAERDYLTGVQTASAKFATSPRDPLEDSALRGFSNLQVVEREQLPLEYVIRVILFSRDHQTSYEFEREVWSFLEQPCYLTHFPLNALVSHRDSDLHVVDIHPPCLGKAEALRYLEETHDIPASRVVAVGDAGNDVPMLERAGLGVAMGNGAQSALEAADRIIASHDTDAIAELVDEVFGG
jgi:5-amino-6-(5-phospho-D-ribitylamino)uracil phosphatase